MKNIKVISLNKSHENPEAFISSLVNITFSKKLNSSEDMLDHFNGIKITNSTKLLETLERLINELNNEDKLDECNWIDLFEIIEFVKQYRAKNYDDKKELIKTIYIRLTKVNEALDNNYMDEALKYIPINGNKDMVNNVCKMNHTGLLEHVNCTYLIQGASRSLLAQITRHRLFSFVSASQHYMDYSDFGDFVIPYELEGDNEKIKEYLEVNKRALQEYSKMIKAGTPHEVARQVLPNSMRNNLVITGNLREWLNFLNLRLCGRNTSEIQYIATQIKNDLKEYVPTIAEYMAPDCVIKGKCTQEHLCCGEKCTDEKLNEKYKVLIKTDAK